MSDPGNTFQVEIAVTPDLSGLPQPLASRLSLDCEAGLLTVRGALDHNELVALRNCDDSPEWQVVVDRIAVACRVRDETRESPFPTTMWGLLLQQLDAGESRHWEEFIEFYRQPIRRVIQRMLTTAGRRDGADDLADGFFGWFAAKQIWRNLRRVDPESGRVMRFRGYLLCCVRTYLGEEVFNRRSREFATAPDDVAFEITGEDQQILDDVFCEDAVNMAMETIREVDHALWSAILADFAGRTLAEVAERMKAESGGRVGSIGTAHARRHDGRQQLRDVLVRYRLRDTTTSEEDAVAEYVELTPILAQHVARYVAARLEA